MPNPDDLERVWWARVDAAIVRQGRAGKKALSDWSHEWLDALGDVPREFPCTDPDVVAEQRRASRRLGERLGVGPPP
jgi:hypothetical protein